MQRVNERVNERASESSPANSRGKPETATWKEEKNSREKCTYRGRTRRQGEAEGMIELHASCTFNGMFLIKKPIMKKTNYRSVVLCLKEAL